MRRSFLLALVLLAPAAASAQTLTAPLGQAVRLPVRGAAADVVVGDPRIADVTVVSPTALFVSGRSYGATNLIVMDAVGRAVFSGRVVVPASDPGQVTIQRGREAQAIFCAPTCDARPGAAAAQRIGTTSAAEAASPAPAAEPTPAATAAVTSG